MSLSEELFNSYNVQKRKSRNLTDSDQSTTYEVFRNNTTAVEVIVKEVSNNRRKTGTPLHHEVTTKGPSQEEVDRLRNELFETNSVLEKSRNGFQVCMIEMKKQLDSATQREMELQTKHLNLKLENEKLKTLLSSKTNLVSRLAKELNILKRVIKSVIKNMINVPKLDANNVSCSSDPDYDEFENNLKGDFKARFDESATFDSTAPKEVKDSGDKRLYE